MKYLKNIDIFEKIRLRGHEYDSYDVENTQVFAVNDGMLINNNLISWNKIKRLYDLYNKDHIDHMEKPHSYMPFPSRS